MADIYYAVRWAVGIANDNTHGYDQANRNGPDYDCSSFVSTALNNAGFNISPSSWTGNMRQQLLSDGWTEAPITAQRRLGHVFLNEQHHVIMCVDDTQIVQASINENGGVTGGQTGDQTGREIYVTNFYTPSYGWDYHLVPPLSSYYQNYSWHAKANGGYARDTSEAQENVLLMASILQSKGWGIESIAAMLGAAVGESGLNPWRWESDYIPTITEAQGWTPAQAEQHGYGMWQFTPYSKYVDNAQSYPGYSPHFADQQGSPLDGQAQTLFANDNIPTSWSHNLYNYYYDDFIAIGVDINDFYFITYEQFKAGNDTLANLTGAFTLCYLRPADWAAAQSYQTRVDNAVYWYNFLTGTPIPPYGGTSGKMNIMIYLKPLWKKQLGG